MTDALAQWFLQPVAAGNQPWGALEPLLATSDEAFAAWVDELRNRQELRNDDVTLLGVVLCPDR